MELGNFCFGNSRGEWPVPRDERYEGPLQTLLEECGCDGYGITERTASCLADGGQPGFENDVFVIRPYWWGGDCECPEGAAERHPACGACRPNFVHKPSGLELQWYKYPLRDSYMSREVGPAEWLRIMGECVSSIGVVP
jgi:hypothetical protein